MEVGNPLLKDADLAEVYSKIEAMELGEIRSLAALPPERLAVYRDCIKFRAYFVGDCDLNSDETKVRKIEKNYT